MSVFTKRVIMIVLLLAGAVWNCLCLTQILPLACFTFSAVAVIGYCLALAFLPALKKTDKNAAEASALTPREKRLSGILIVMLAAWLITLAACIVYPL